MIELAPKHHPTAAYQQRIREMMSTKYPNVQGYFMAADMVNQVWLSYTRNFGGRMSTPQESLGDFGSSFHCANRVYSIASVAAI